MSDEKKKPEEDEVADEQLEDVAGGVISNVRIVEAQPSIKLDSDRNKQSTAQSFGDMLESGLSNDPDA